jgi:hypothetical protein
MMNNQEIINNAPDGATHVDNWGRFKKVSHPVCKETEKLYEWYDNLTSNDIDKPSGMGFRSLADIKRIVKLEKERDLLKMKIILMEHKENMPKNIISMGALKEHKL